MSGLIFHNGIGYIIKSDLAKLFGVDPKNINYYENKTKFKDPLKRVDNDIFEGKYNLPKRSIYYDLVYAINWHRDNIDLSKAVKRGEANIDKHHKQDDTEYNKDDEITIVNMKAAKEFESALKEKELRIKEEIANSVRRGELISIDDFDRASATLLTNMLVAMTNVIEELPSSISTSLKGIDKEQVKKIISINFKHTMDDLKEKLESYE